MRNLITKLIEDKKEYRDQIERAKALPEDYRFVFEKIQKYMWRLASGDGSEMLMVQKEILELFEACAAEGQNILDVTGEDVAGFCDDFMRDMKKWTDNYRKKLNSDLINKLGR